MSITQRRDVSGSSFSESHQWLETICNPERHKDVFTVSSDVGNMLKNAVVCSLLENSWSSIWQMKMFVCRPCWSRWTLYSAMMKMWSKVKPVVWFTYLCWSDGGWGFPPETEIHWVTPKWSVHVSGLHLHLVHFMSSLSLSSFQSAVCGFVFPTWDLL